MRLLAFAFLLASTLPAGDVLVLKGGGRVSGRVVEKAEHYEVTSDGVLRTYLKEEVDKVVNSPKEFLGDADKLFDEARADYQKALGISETGAKNAVLKEAIAKVARARESYSAALELFPDDGTLGKQIMLLMQLMRLLRERVSLDDSRGPVVGGGPSVRPTPVVTVQADDALSTLLDPARRGDPARRAAAVESFRSQKTDLACAGIMFLSKSDADMKLQGPALKAAQDYFEKPWLKEPAKLTAPIHLQAAQHLAQLRGTSPAAADALLPFAIAHLSGAGPGPEPEKTARTLGLALQNGLVGTPEGHAVRDLNTWIANGEFDLAVMAFVNEFRSIDTPAVRYVWSYALLRLVQSRKRGFERPVSAFETVKFAPDHIAALSKSIKSVAICNACTGGVKLRCTNCHGKKETRFVCAKCKGKGFSVNTLGAMISCVPCRATGVSGILKCEKCKDGFFDCKQCDKKPRTAPELDDIYSAAPCGPCDGRGLAFRNAAVPCRSCLGLGQKLAPKSDPAKILP